MEGTAGVIPAPLRNYQLVQHGPGSSEYASVSICRYTPKKMKIYTKYQVLDQAQTNLIEPFILNINTAQINRKVLGGYMKSYVTYLAILMH